MVQKRPAAAGRSVARKSRPTKLCKVSELKNITKSEAQKWKGVSLRVRKLVAADGTRVKDHGDMYIMKKMFVQRPYMLLRRKFVAGTRQAGQDLFQGRRVADLGSSLGCFALASMAGGAAAVLAVEPDPETSCLLRANLNRQNQSRLEYEGTLEVQQAAVVSDSERSTTVSLGANRERSGVYAPSRPNRNSMLHGTDAQQVKAMRISKILREFRPEVLKMDIEGCEKSIVEAGSRFPGVQELLCYWHFDHHPMLRDFKAFLDSLRGIFSKVDYESTPAVPRSWKWESQLAQSPDLRPKKVEGPAAAKKDVLVYCAR